MSLPIRPTADAEFASGNSVAIAEPTQLKKETGWLAEKPPHQYFNWLQRQYWLWQIYFDRRIVYTQLVSAAGAYAPGVTRSRRVHMDATAGNQTFTLPAITTADNDLEFLIKRVDGSANTVTITGTVEGQVNPTIDYQYTGVGVYAFGGNWYWSK